MAYSLDISLHIRRTITSLLAFPKWMAYVRALLAPASQIQTEFIEFQSKILDQVNRNSQTLIIQNYLISKFGNGIFIQNIKNNSPNIYVGHLAEQVEDDDIYVGHIGELGDDVWIGHNSEHRSLPFNFIIYIPTSLALTAEQLSNMRAIVDLYKFSSLTYDLQFY